MLIRKTLFYFIILVSCISFSSNAQIQVNDYEYSEIKDISSEWFVYSRDLKLFVPYISSLNNKSNSIYLKLDPDFYAGRNLYIYLPSKAGLFIENELVEYSNEGHYFIYSIEL